MTTYRNDRSGEVVNTDLSTADVLKRFGETARPDNWLWFWLIKHVERTREQESRGTAAGKDMITFLADSFLFATGMGLKRPMIRLHHKDHRYKIYLSQRGTMCFKSGRLVPGTHDPEGDEEYMGCLAHGCFLPNDRREMVDADKSMLEGLGSDPVRFLVQSSKDMGRCCYCNLPLDDPRSKACGYGATCAKHWGLPWGKTYDEKVPSFATLWLEAGGTAQDNIRGMCAAIREDVTNETLWKVLGDALQDAGYVGKLPQAPKASVRLART